MKYNKGFSSIAIILIIIVVLAVGGVAYYARQSSNNTPRNIPSTTTVTTSLKTYLNSQYGFSIQYPNNFRESETNDGGFFNELNIFNASIDVPIGYQNGTD